jgi:hypothetical protein
MMQTATQRHDPLVGDPADALIRSIVAAIVRAAAVALLLSSPPTHA